MVIWHCDKDVHYQVNQVLLSLWQLGFRLDLAKSHIFPTAETVLLEFGGTLATSKSNRAMALPIPTQGATENLSSSPGPSSGRLGHSQAARKAGRPHELCLSGPPPLLTFSATAHKRGVSSRGSRLGEAVSSLPVNMRSLAVLDYCRTLSAHCTCPVSVCKCN